MIKYSCLMMIGLCSAMSYSAQPPTPSKRIQYDPAELVAYSPPHTPVPDKEKLLARLPAAKKNNLSVSFDSSEDVATNMKPFCDAYKADAQKIAPAVMVKFSKSASASSALEKKQDEPA